MGFAVSFAVGLFYRLQRAVFMPALSGWPTVHALWCRLPNVDTLGTEHRINHERMMAVGYSGSNVYGGHWCGADRSSKALEL
jgi:hypothetical protein